MCVVPQREWQHSAQLSQSGQKVKTSRTNKMAEEETFSLDMSRAACLVVLFSVQINIGQSVACCHLWVRVVLKIIVTAK